MAPSPDPRIPWYTPVDPVTVEKHTPDSPHQGKVLAAVQAHADDIPLFCAGLVAKLIAEGYTAYLIQTTNDEKCGPGTMGETILQNEREVEVLAKELGFKQVIHLGYRNHFLDEAAPTELRARLVFLIRALKIDTITTFSPWGHWEENPDHYVTGQAVEAARWMAGMNKDYPEQLACGMQPHSVKDLYYWTCRPGQPYNTVVDIAPHLDAKVAAMSANKAQGPAGAHGRRLKERLARQGKHLPALGQRRRGGRPPVHPPLWLARIPAHRRALWLKLRRGVLLYADRRNLYRRNECSGNRALHRRTRRGFGLISVGARVAEQRLEEAEPFTV